VVVLPGATVGVPGAPGAMVSVLPVHGAARGVRTEGLKWRLDGEVLDAGTTRGVSNEIAEPGATVSVDDGVLAVVLPATGVAR
jgi:thiamine pyrophosphokinase